MENKNWYVAKNAYGGQGLVIEEETGRNIAVVYDPADTDKIAAVPQLLEALRVVYHRTQFTNINTPLKDMQDTWDILRQALELAGEKS